MRKKQTVDMCNGPILKNVMLYALPLILTGLLQLLYNAADIIVVARYAGGTALAAVGSNGPLINLIVNIFVGMSVGASVIVSRYYGAGDKRNLHESVHSAMTLSIICGVITLVIGLIAARAEQRKPHKYPLEQIMQTYGLEAKDLIMVDDLKPGYDMAKACGVTFVGAGWCNEIPEIRDFMKQNSDIYLTKVSELEKILFE